MPARKFLSSRLHAVTCRMDSWLAVKGVHAETRVVCQDQSAFWCDTKEGSCLDQRVIDEGCAIFLTGELDSPFLGKQDIPRGKHSREFRAFVGIATR